MIFIAPAFAGWFSTLNNDLEQLLGLLYYPKNPVVTELQTGGSYTVQTAGKYRGVAVATTSAGCNIKIGDTSVAYAAANGANNTSQWMYLQPGTTFTMSGSQNGKYQRLDNSQS